MLPTRFKVLDLAGALDLRARLRESRRRVVFTNGCYDLLHPGHVKLLEEARALGDALFVGLNSDASVARLKGPERPILTASERAETIAALRAVDAVVVFDEETPDQLVRALVPDVLVKGADWGETDIVGRDTVEAAGGRVARLPIVAGYSTSALIETVRSGVGPFRPPRVR